VPDESELAELVGRGDEAAFRSLVARETRYLYGVAHALTANAADAEDLVQETFIAAASGRFRGEASVRTWLVRILLRRAGMLRRRQRRHKLQQPLDQASADVATVPETEVVDARMDLSRMLQNLSPDHRAVIVLRELQGMSYDEMATALGVPRGTVESRLHRAREELRRQFKGYL
jgi:RNA polymerase sigma-70 factor, ECF subfamily